ncbi:uncharacterized protein [Henckelia pumila]|uniref:uncharacterized protein n=1 Tax=Henckelia pumila TaxID=405737 RepID=UPI003C6DB8B0
MVSKINQPLISKMKAMVAKKGWFSRILELREVKIPQLKDDEVLIKVCATGVNRGDIIDVATSDNSVCPGLECSGIIEAVGRNITCWKVGERVCALLEGRGYAEQVAVPANCLLPLPDDIDLDVAAALPYASCSIWLALFRMSDPESLKDKSILIREGASGIGALAIQYAKYMGFKVIVTTGSSEHFSICHTYGADTCIDHTLELYPPDRKLKLGALSDFVYAVRRTTKFSEGVDFVVDYGASNLRNNVQCCRPGGKVVILDLFGTGCNSVDLAKLQEKHIEIRAFDLRYRDLDYKASVIAKVRTHLWPFILQQKVIPFVKHRFPMIEAQKALNLLKKNGCSREDYCVYGF